MAFHLLQTHAADGGACRCGHGHCRYTDGSEYDGEWLHDMRHGSGRMTLSNGTVYDGQWRDDKLHGAGVCWLKLPAATWLAGLECSRSTLQNELCFWQTKRTRITMLYLFSFAAWFTHVHWSRVEQDLTSCLTCACVVATKQPKPSTLQARPTSDTGSMAKGTATASGSVPQKQHPDQPPGPTTQQRDRQQQCSRLVPAAAALLAGTGLLRRSERHTWAAGWPASARDMVLQSTQMVAGVLHQHDGCRAVACCGVLCAALS